MFNKLILFINKIALINVVTPRRALTAYIKALCLADLDGNGELSVKELFKQTKSFFKALIFAPDMTDEEIHNSIDEILSKKM